jgi:apolipoprotein N-acyltransferase
MPPWILLGGAFLLSLALYFFSFPPFGLFPIAWIAPLPLLWAEERYSFKDPFLLWWLWGSLFFLLSLSWLPGTMESYAPVASWQALLAYGALSFYLGIYWGLWGWWSHRLLSSGIPAFLAFPLPLAFLEYLRGHLLSGFPWLLAAHSQAPFLSFIQGASIIGVYGLSFLLAWSWGGIWDVIKGKRKRGAFSLLLPLTLILWGGIRIDNIPHGLPLKVALVQPNVPPRIKWDPAWGKTQMELLARMTGKSCKQGGLVVLPESAVPYYLFQDIKETGFFLKGLQSCKAYILVGTNHWVMKEKEAFLKNRAYLLSPQGQEEGHYDKIHLVPFGEYVPLARFLPFLYTLAGYQKGFLPGKSTKPLPFPPLPLGVDICYEAIFPGLVRSRVGAGAKLLVNITNDGWFGRSLAPHQHLTAALFRSVENGRWMVRCANSGISAIISPEGKIVASLPLFTQGILRERVEKVTLTTLYTLLGDWLPLASGLISCLFLVIEGFKTKELFDNKGKS